jgi:hypothetical protein
MENEIAEEQKAMQTSPKTSLSTGLSSRSKEHILKTPFGRHPHSREAAHIRAAKLHLGMYRSAQEEGSELERLKKELEHYMRRDIEHVQVRPTQQIESLKSTLRRQETHFRVLKEENERLQQQTMIPQATYDDTELLLALQLSAAESGVQTQFIYDPDQMSYEQLIELGDQIGSVSVGLTPAQFEGLRERVCDSVLTTCSICQTDIDTGDCYICLPACPHLHHTECVKQWFQHKNACPVCKASAIAK